MINPGKNKFGFSEDLFGGYLWEVDNVVWISLIISNKPGQGNTQRLFKRILKEGYTIKVPTPSTVMEIILRKMDFKETIEWFGEPFNENGVVWVKST